jgi:hypothetical protein
MLVCGVIGVNDWLPSYFIYPNQWPVDYRMMEYHWVVFVKCLKVLYVCFDLFAPYLCHLAIICHQLIARATLGYVPLNGVPCAPVPAFAPMVECILA